MVSNFRQNIQSYGYDFQTGTLTFIARDRGRKRIFVDTAFSLNNDYPIHPTKRKDLLNSHKELDQDPSSISAKSKSETEMYSSGPFPFLLK